MPLLTRKTETVPNFFSFNFLRVPRAGEGQATSDGGIPPEGLAQSFGDGLPVGLAPAKAPDRLWAA